MTDGVHASLKLNLIALKCCIFIGLSASTCCVGWNTNRHQRNCKISAHVQSLLRKHTFVKQTPTLQNKQSNKILTNCYFESLTFIHRLLLSIQTRRSLYLSSKAATPGKVLPSSNSNEAPPPVEMWLILLARPAFSTAATESPPPIMVVHP